MKVAIYGQYYQNSTEPIIRDIFVFFNSIGTECFMVVFVFWVAQSNVGFNRNHFALVDDL